MRDRLASPEEVAAATADFVEERERIAKEPLAERVAAELTAHTDRWIARLWEVASSELGFTSHLIALGGYGRRELSLGSDVDLAIAIPDDAVETPELHEAARHFMAWCRDARVKVSHAVRAPHQIPDVLAEDVRTAVAYLDARPVRAEDVEAAAEGFSRAAAFLRADDDGVGFVQQLFLGYRHRIERFGKTVYRLEPDVKNGQGGLRDLHAVAWAAKVRFDFDPLTEVRAETGWTEEHRSHYAEGRAWLLQIRHQLHARHGRKSDRLWFADQTAIGAKLWPDHPARDAAERLMRSHYSRARTISKLSERFLRRWDISTAEPVELAHTPFVMIGDVMGLKAGVELQEPEEVAAALRAASDNDVLLEPKLEDALETAIAQWDDDEVRTPRVGRVLASLLTDPSTSERTAQRLLDLGFLTRVVPEFEPIVCHVQHDVYHVYTTDVHSLKCHEMAGALVAGRLVPKWPIFAAIAREIEEVDLFLLAVLFHDIGKNRGGGHSRRGAIMMYDVGPRLGLDARQTDQLSYLVREHLALSHAARRHDISDPRIIRDLATRIRRVETLNQLTALTFCDMSNVGDDVMNDWNASLLTSLHRRLRVAIEHGVGSLWQQLGETLEQHQDTVVELYSARTDTTEAAARSALDEFFRDVPAGHIVETAPAALLRQFDVYKAGKESEAPRVLSTPIEERAATEIIVSSRDVPGALARITGAISSLGLNILTAQIVTTASNQTLDIFRVAQSGGAAHALTPGSQTALTDEHRIARLEERLTQVLSGEVSVEELLRRRIEEKRLADRETPPVDTGVREVPDLSDDFTVIEVKAPDRIGLLYEIASTLQSLDVNIHLSKIDALGTQVIDTFFVETTDGRRLEGDHLERVIAALSDVVEASRL